MLQYRLRNLSADRERAREERKQGGGRGQCRLLAHGLVHSQAGYLWKMQGLQLAVEQPSRMMVLQHPDAEAGQSCSEKSWRWG